MNLSLKSECKCRLELGSESVELTLDELSSLRDCLPQSGRAAKEALPPELFKRLFETGMLLPQELSNVADLLYWKTSLPKLGLSPYLNVFLALTSERGAVDKIEPAIALYLDAEFVDVAARLSSQIDLGVEEVALASAARRLPFPEREALALVHSVARQWLEQHPESKRWIDWETDDQGLLRINLRNDSFSNQSAGPWHVLLRFNLQQGSSIISREVLIPIGSLKKIVAVMDELRCPSGISDDHLSSVDVRRVLGAIEAVGGLIPREDLPVTFPRKADSYTSLAITHMGHASLIVDGGGQRVLIDPFLFNWESGFETQPLVSKQLGEVDAILFTHHHNDHLNFGSLFTLPHDVPVFVPRSNRDPLGPRTADFLSEVGFSDVRELAHGEIVELGGGMTIEAVPFFGEGKNHLGFDANCYLVSRNGNNVLVHADASPDSDGQSIVSSGSLDEIVARRGQIAAVFGTWWQDRTFRVRLSPLLIFQGTTAPADWLKETEMCDSPPEFVCALIRSSGAKMLLTYAESARECFLPRHQMSAYVPTISLLWKSLADVQETVREQTVADMIEAQPYLTVVIDKRGGVQLDYSMVGESRKALEAVAVNAGY